MKSQEVKNKEFKEKIKIKLGEDYTVLGDYINNRTKIKMRHETCGTEYDTLACQLTRAKPTRCPHCFGTPKKTQEEFEKEVNEKGNGEYKVIGKYRGTNVKIKMIHETCGTEWLVKPNNFLNNNTRCPLCSHGDSEGVKIIKDYLDLNSINYVTEKTFSSCKYKRKLKFDFFLKDFNLLLEFDGDFHFKNPYDEETLKLARKRDAIKNKWVKKEKISILRIDETNKKNIDRILDEFLKESSSTTIKNYNLYYINEDSSFINDNNKYDNE